MAGAANRGGPRYGFTYGLNLVDISIQVHSALIFFLSHILLLGWCGSMAWNDICIVFASWKILQLNSRDLPWTHVQSNAEIPKTSVRLLLLLVLSAPLPLVWTFGRESSTLLDCLLVGVYTPLTLLFTQVDQQMTFQKDLFPYDLIIV